MTVVSPLDPLIGAYVALLYVLTLGYLMIALAALLAACVVYACAQVGRGAMWVSRAVWNGDSQ